MANFVLNLPFSGQIPRTLSSKAKIEIVLQSNFVPDLPFSGQISGT
jgi:hypothetical protein